MAAFLILILFFNTYSCENNVEELFKGINEATVKFNAIGANIAWQSAMNPGNPALSSKTAVYQEKLLSWQHRACRKLVNFHEIHALNLTQERQAYLLCRGPKYTYREAREISKIYEELQSIYSNAEVCLLNNIEKNKTSVTSVENAIRKYILNIKYYLKLDEISVPFAAKIAARDLKKDGICLKGEEDFEKVMEHSREREILEWVWLAWREKMTLMKELYEKLIYVENKAARRNGYTDIGASWRDELEIPNLREISHKLYKNIKPLYALLHGVVRYYLRREYGDIVPEKGPIPAHLLGNLWSQNWEPILDMIVPNAINLDDRMKSLNWTVKDMVKRAEDFYVSIGLPPMTDTFWQKSVFSRDNHSLARCHGTAADMFKHDDFRLLYCSRVSFEDFYVIHHEMGHIQYYMAYKNQPGLFRQANSALQETIGDTIMYAVMTPQHLHRIRLINDSELYNIRDPYSDEDYITKGTLNSHRKLIKYSDYKGGQEFVIDSNNIKHNQNDEYRVTTDDILILKQALNKIPQIPFSLLMDEYRWKYFEGGIDKDFLNDEFWALAQDLQGIAPSGVRGEEYFDIGAKFHVPDNTPYIRYFLSSFLQHQLFEALCKAAVFGHRNVKDPLPPTIYLNRCDIYGSKAAGRILKDLMSRGHSQHWRQILKETIGEVDISATALKRHYRPLYVILMRLVEKYRIPIGW
ncbi:angiotensin-converting enzyme-like [Vanessa cardui]|uniref:angiotensin-converting enzyme-like n=1 Tax=Vanessa cardui TaxID=171605 RepID=UPI001F13D262|nr:angiotensin-converting enzyme-like [Vanessa cardui]